MRIDTEIEGFFEAKTGSQMVRFTAVKKNGQFWAAPRHLVEAGLRHKDLAPGLAVEIRIEDGRVIAVASDEVERKPSRGVQPASGGPRHAEGRPRRGFSQAAGRVASSGTIIPYGFVSLDTGAAITDTPICHDGSAGGRLLSGEFCCSLEALTPLMPGNARYTVEEANRRQLAAWGMPDLPDEKQIAEPLRLEDGRVVIAGSSIKGMLRQSLSALLSAPMERVKERRFTYRPNLDFSRNQAKYGVCPALVTGARQEGWDIEVFADPRAAVFRRPDFKAHYRTVNYVGGIDGDAILATAFGTRVYRQAQVPPTGDGTLHIPGDLYHYYLAQQTDVLANNVEGHLTAHPLTFNVDETKAAIVRNAALRPGQLIYVEVTTDARGGLTSTSRVVSFGHHFRYRWAYSSSIRTKGGVTRDCLAPLPDEIFTDGDGAPNRLSGARLLFGYVRNDKTNPIGRGAFQRFAGRIAINHALSVGLPEFLGKDRGCCVPLPILGQPKPSAWELYLQQDGRLNLPPATYGDLPGDDGGDLAGRKYYRHQTAAQARANLEKGADFLNDAQATLARFVCKEGTSFRFTVRFARLREWELGALLAVLEPTRLGQADTQYAHKLGLGRPLGLGSVTITIDKVLVRKDEDTSLPEFDNRDAYVPSAIQGLQTKLARIPAGWLEMHTYPEAGSISYPAEHAKVRNPGPPMIYDWHTNLRRDYSKLRRERDPDWRELKTKIRNVNPGASREPT